MSSSNDTYHPSLFVQAQPKSILKKSSSPKFADTSIDLDSTVPILPSTNEAENDNKITENSLCNEEHVCILNDNSYPSSIELPTIDLSMISNEIDRSLIRTLPRADSSSSSLTVTSDDDDEHNRCVRFQPKKMSHRSFVNPGTLSSSSSDNEKRKSKRATKESRSILLRSNQSCPTDMQLDEFIRKYQQEGRILLPTKEDYSKQRITNKLPINHRQQESRLYQDTPPLIETSTKDDTLGLLDSIVRMTQTTTTTTTNALFSPLQFLFNLSHDQQNDRRMKIDRLRQYLEEEIGISPFLTMYKLIKSSQIPVRIQDKPFCYYANFLPHLCCLIVLESEEQKKFISR